MVRAGRSVYQKHDDGMKVRPRLEYINAIHFMLDRICTNAEGLQARYAVSYNTHAMLHANARI